MSKEQIELWASTPIGFIEKIEEPGREAALELCFAALAFKAGQALG